MTMISSMLGSGGDSTVSHSRWDRPYAVPLTIKRRSIERGQTPVSHPPIPMGCSGSTFQRKSKSGKEVGSLSNQDPPELDTNTQNADPPSDTAAIVPATAAAITNKQLRIFIVFYSMYGHVELMAKRVKKGVDSIDGVEGVLYRVPETLPQAVLEQMRAPIKEGDEVPVVSPNELTEADGFLFGFPTRFGSMAAQMKAFFDSTDALWCEQKLAGKPGGFFVSTGSQGGGQETTAWTAITQLTHHGMIYVPIGYTFGAGMFKMDTIRGGSPYGAGVFSGDGTREPNETELALAEYHGKYMATIVQRLSGPS